MNKRLTLAAATALAMLGACGGGGGDASPPDAAAPDVTSMVPGDVSQSVAAMMGYLVALVASKADGLEPVDVNAVTPPTDNAAEPQAID